MSGALRLAAWASWAVAAHTAVNARLLRRPVASPRRRSVSLLLPLRDEAHRVEPCLRALLAVLDATPGAELLVLDDGSSDGTADVVRAVCGERARVLRGAPLPPGWLGKPHACQQLADAAAGEVLVFVDADVVLAPDAVAAALPLLDELDLVSPYPRQVAPGATRLVQPLLQWSWLALLPLRLAERSPRPSLSAANGQLLLVRRDAYDRAGGHAAVRDAVVEDVALVRRVKATGGRGGVVDGTALAECRMYGSWRELADGYAKSADQVPVAALAALVALYVVPAVAALRGSRAGAVAYAGGVASRVVAARRTGGRAADAPSHPVSVVALAGLAVRARLLRRRGGVRWKGRVVP